MTPPSNFELRATTTAPKEIRAKTSENSVFDMSSPALGASCNNLQNNI